MSRAVSTIDYKALAERIEELAKWVRQYSHRMSDDVADLRTVVTLLDWMAEAEPVAWIKTTHAGVRRLEWNEQTHYANDDYPATTEPLITYPAPQPQFTGRDDRIECDECGKKFTPQMLPIHKCEPTEAQIEPLTDAQIQAMWEEENVTTNPFCTNLKAWTRAVRAAERAHGISAALAAQEQPK